MTYDIIPVDRKKEWMMHASFTKPRNDFHSERQVTQGSKSAGIMCDLGLRNDYA